MEKIEILFEEAIKLRDSGKLNDAVDKLNHILSEHTKYDAPVLGILGNIYWDLDNLPKALECYEKAVELKPKSELGVIRPNTRNVSITMFYKV